MSTRIGFIGLGAMGLPMSSNLQRKGFAVTVYDLDETKMAEVVALGAARAASVAEASREQDIVITVLPATQHVESVVLGVDGVLANIGPDAVVMDLSTIDANGTDRVAKACSEKGVAFVDAPIGRLALHAQRGESLFMVGAKDVDFVRVEPALKAMGTDIFRCGEPGMGSRMKVINNFMLLSTAQIVAESIALGAKLGLDIQTMHDVTANTTARNGQFHVLMVNKVLRGDVDPGFTIDLAFKDLSLAMNAAAEHRVGLPMGAAAHAVFGGARAGEFAVKDYSALLDYACRNAGVDTPRMD
ncbi:NAD(P)-dependent oxidoreductase [Novosphingobium sp. P6W]|uniref:NAD(P)-dependent oxidoreductase n=1 Tax=Novosphingobium sp. P6W TaxID=1609758 RepID=UPI0005C2D9B0|nr:NAD(P)-dependent oxidoreductase [Novosphingobium sp. P6W]AXB80298.1 NAD(P)-dependent oxidoreductase [Novosphingobium sp. P6W]KIS31632.1 hydroxyacid dehydrogenase [Novosphingobium sp. P6W]